MQTKQKRHFVLIKKADFDNHNRLLSATETAAILLERRIWPLWERTRCQKMVERDHEVLIYLAGDERDCKHVVARAAVKDVIPWASEHKKTYPLLLDVVPSKLLLLQKVELFQTPINIRDKLDQLSFLPANKTKWGIAFMGGMRAISAADFALLSGAGD